MKMTLNTQEVTNTLLNHTATQLNVCLTRLQVVMKADGSAVIYLDQEPDAPVRRNRKGKAEAPVAAQEVPAPVFVPHLVEEVQEDLPFSVDTDKLEEEVTEEQPAVATAPLWP